MDKSLIAATLKKVRDNSPKRNFKQSLDLIINLKGIDIKKAEHQINMFAALHYSTGKNISVCALVDSDLASKAREICDETILADEFGKFKSKAAAKKLANGHDFFVAQASIMPKVAAAFGRYLGPRGKMPNPKIGSVLTPASNIRQLYDRLKTTILLATKNEPTIKCRVGNEDSKDEELIDNIMTVYNNIIQKLPNDKQNIKSIMLKLTMGPSFAIGSEEPVPKKSMKKSRAEEKRQTKPVAAGEGKESQNPEDKSSKEGKTAKKPQAKKPDTGKSK